jgi:hypothetical protein
MRRVQLLILAIWGVFATVPMATAETPPSETIAIETTESSYVLTVPVSHLTMTIPKGNLVLKNNAVGGSTNNPRYFYFEDSTVTFIVSGWFEPAQKFSGLKKFWEDEMNAWKRNRLPEPQNVSFSNIGNWQTITYEVKAPRGTNSHIRAHWVQADTWIDIHLSLTSDRTTAESRKFLESRLRDISVKEKS